LQNLLDRTLGKDADREIWKFDAGSISKMMDALKQAAIEEGQWGEKREAKGSVSIDVFRARLHAGRDGVAAAKRAALAKGETCP
jgi:hypothetical protein